MASTDIRVERSLRHVASIVIDRPTKSNALTPDAAVEIESALRTLEADLEIRAIAIRGAGGRAFCGGYDLSRVDTGVRDDELQSMLRTLRAVMVPTVAIVDGHAVGAGLDLACSCDLRVVRVGIKIGLPAVRMGVAYHATGLRRIMAMMPAARRFLLTGELMRAEDVEGFIDVPSDSEGFERCVGELLGHLSDASSASLAYMVAMIRPRAFGESDLTSAMIWRDRILDGPDARIAAEARRVGHEPTFTPRVFDGSS